MLDGKRQGAVPPLNLIALDEREIEDFERLVYRQQHELATRHLLLILERAYRIYHTTGQLVAPEAERYRYTRLAAAVGALLASPGFQMSDSGFASLALHHSTLGFLFSASAFANADHVAALVGTRDRERPEKLDYGSREKLLKLLLLRSLDSPMDLDLEAILRSDPVRLLPLYAGMLNRYLFLTSAAHHRRELLLGLGEIFGASALPMQCLPALSVAWMNCMYATGESKNAIRGALNRLVSRVPGNDPPFAARPRKALRERPVMLVPLEDFRSRHVNHKTFGAVVRQLRAHFTLVGAATPQALDDASRELFDRILVVDTGDGGERGFAELRRRLLEVGADIVYYPTIGMHPWCIVMATQRLAPIQLTSMGVPASTHSEAIDYAVIEESWAGYPDCYTETVVHTRKGSTRFVAHDRGAARPAEPARKSRRRPGPFRIAVPSMFPKLNFPFLEACARIAREARVPLEWHFLAGLTGLQHAVATRQIRNMLPDALVYPNLDYDAYLQVLAPCDLHLSTFPFGGTNTNIDTMRLGIPMITLEGREPHSQIDAGMIRRMGLPDWLITHSMDEYVRTALRLIHGPKELEKVRGRLRGRSVDEVFMDSASAGAEDFAQAICWIYENDDALRRAGQKVWTVAQRDAQARLLI